MASHHFACTNTYTQMRGTDFSGRKPGPLKGYPALPPQWVLGAVAPPTRMVAKLKILKRFEILENDSIFQKYQDFSCQKNRLFLRNRLRCLKDFTKISEFFPKII